MTEKRNLLLEISENNVLKETSMKTFSPFSGAPIQAIFT